MRVGWVQDVAANLVADLMAAAALYAFGPLLVDRFVERVAVRRVYVVVEADMENYDWYDPQEPPRRLRVTNLSDLPFYDCSAFARAHDAVPQQFASADQPILYGEPLPAGETVYSDWFHLPNGKVFDSVDVSFESVRGGGFECVAVGSRPARVRASVVSPLGVVRRVARRLAWWM